MIAQRLEDRSPEVRAAAVMALGQLNAREYTTQIQQLLDDYARVDPVSTHVARQAVAWGVPHTTVASVALEVLRRFE
jgi:HEAT repeat protein